MITGQVQLAREPHLRSKHRVLDLARREIVVVVEADLPDGARPRRGLELCADDRGGARRVVGELVRVMRMDADRDPHLGPDRGERERLRRFLRVARRQDRQDPLDAAVARTANDRLEIGGKHLVGQMTV